ncbi:vacuolar-sorting protein SNF8-like [Paramacrobiotus metropolitanus]|uniref:vacuolar-sorting protein SNF8-like n=1 Tax=Paramacrobiotus metropolitanus TaxID=2943436 RepID=UPI002445BF25|nr:vacuolar-sorting protein SNF8-like [Paramacrobiotus metropolitanus]
MHRRAGIGAIDKKKMQEARFKDRGEELAADQLRQLSGQLGTLRDKLKEFATRHKNEIRKDPEFRRQFQEMCATIGVDPLASSKGFWSEMLGVGDFYYELGVQIVEICMANNHKNGGIMALDELFQRLVKSRGQTGGEQLSTDDVLRAMDKLKILGNGFSLIKLQRGRMLVQSVPGELSLDQNQVMLAAQETAHTSVRQLQTSLRWQEERAAKVLEDMVTGGMAWVDLAQRSEPVYWFPSLFNTGTVAPD